MKNSTKHLTKIILLLIAAFAPALNLRTQSVYALTAREIIKKSEAALRGNTLIALYEITIKTRRWTRTLRMKSWENRLQKKSFAEIISPKKDAGNRFLLINKNMHQFIPKLQRVIKISPSMMLQSWMGSDFSNDDIVKESSIVEDYFHRNDGTAAINGQECYKIVLSPRPESAVVWGKIIYYARKKDLLPVKKEFYNEHNVLKKVLTCSDFAFMHSRVIPTKYKMQTVKKKNRYTIMKIVKAKFNVPVSSRIFSIQNLQRR